MRRYRARDERGAVLILSSLSVVALLGFAAFAVDLAAAWSQDRQNQGAVDTGSIAGGIQTSGQTRDAAIARAETEIVRITYSSLSPPMSFEEWEAAWTACLDADRPLSYTTPTGTDCISFTDSLERLRVRIPDVNVPTSFGKVIGRDTIVTSAAAEMEIAINAIGQVLPVGLSSTAAADTHVCLKTGPSTLPSAICNGPDNGNFAFLDITQFGNISYNTLRICTGTTAERMIRSIAQGVDHPIDNAPAAASPPRSDGVWCDQGNINSRPYSLQTETGNMSGVLHDGLIEGLAGITGRLLRSETLVPVASSQIDDTPIWSMLTDYGNGICGYPTTHAAVITCLDTVWQPDDGPIFDDMIIEQARWGWVPVFFSGDYGNGTTLHNIAQFVPVWLQTTLWKCNSTTCRAIHNPGEPLGGTGAGSGNTQIEALTAIQIPADALSPWIIAAGPGGDGFVRYTIIE